MLTFNGYCRYGAKKWGKLNFSLTVDSVLGCYDLCRATDSCTAFSFKKAVKGCSLFKGGPYTYGNGRHDVKCYVMPKGIVITLYKYKLNVLIKY